MTEHEYEGLVSNDNILRCRTCGQILGMIEQTISKVVSAYRARKVLEEIAVAGKYTIIGFNEDFPIYSIDKDGITEEITASKLGEREYRIIKRIMSKGGDA